MILSIFSYTCWQFMCLIWGNVMFKSFPHFFLIISVFNRGLCDLISVYSHVIKRKEIQTICDRRERGRAQLLKQ